MKKKLLVLMILFCFTITGAFAYTPFSYTFILDASGSISSKDFKELNSNIADVIDYLYDQSQNYIGQTANQISVAWFGGNDKYVSTPYYNGSDKTKMNELFSELKNKTHPSFPSTAIYSAIWKGINAAESLDAEKKVYYQKVIFLITDGQDNNSPAEYMPLFRQRFPDDEIILIVIGVGDGARVNDFVGYADFVNSIDKFDDISTTILYLNEVWGDNYFRISNGTGYDIRSLYLVTLEMLLDGELGKNLLDWFLYDGETEEILYQHPDEEQRLWELLIGITSGEDLYLIAIDEDSDLYLKKWSPGTGSWNIKFTLGDLF